MKRYKKPADIKVGVIGYGPSFNMGKYHVEQMQRVGMVPLAVADIDPARLVAAEKDFPGLSVYPSATALLKKSDADLLVIVTPHNSHAKLAIQCLQAGRHVIVEKPMAITTADCDAMMAAARKSGTMLSVHHNRHWDGCVIEALRQISTGMLGDLVRVTINWSGYGRPGDWWRSSRSISGGMLYDWGVHLVEYALQVIDSRLTEVTGFAREGFWADKTHWKKDTNEDEAVAVARFANGVSLTMTVSSIDSNSKRGWVEFTGTKGSYLFDGERWESFTHVKGNAVSTKGKNPPSPWGQFYDNVLAHLTKGEKLIITPQWSRRPIHLIDLACQSARKGATLKAKYD